MRCPVAPPLLWIRGRILLPKAIFEQGFDNSSGLRHVYCAQITSGRLSKYACVSDIDHDAVVLDDI